MVNKHYSYMVKLNQYKEKYCVHLIFYINVQYIYKILYVLMKHLQHQFLTKKKKKH